MGPRTNAKVEPENSALVDAMEATNGGGAGYDDPDAAASDEMEATNGGGAGYDDPDAAARSDVAETCWSRARTVTLLLISLLVRWYWARALPLMARCTALAHTYWAWAMAILCVMGFTWWLLNDLVAWGILRGTINTQPPQQRDKGCWYERCFTPKKSSRCWDCIGYIGGCRSRQTLLLIIEELGADTPTSDIEAFCSRSKPNKNRRHAIATPFDSSINQYMERVTTLRLVDFGFQYYEASALHRCPHYMLSEEAFQSVLDLLPHPIPNVGESRVRIPSPRDLLKLHSVMSREAPPLFKRLSLEAMFKCVKMQMETVVKAGRLKWNYRGNSVWTRGFSKMNQKSRKTGGSPGITRTLMPDHLDWFYGPLLVYMSDRILAKGAPYKIRGDIRFSRKLRSDNFFEAVAITVSRGPDVNPHMDRENGPREGHDIMAGISFTGVDLRGVYRISVFGYTRKCVGDELVYQHRPAHL